VIELRGVAKRYTKYDDTPALVTSLMRLGRRTRRSTLWALDGVDLHLEEGETAGVLGRNGSGKSTMLRLLAGVTAPTRGSVAVHGRIAPLISVGVGFHNELTGRENVFINGAIFGLSNHQMADRFDEIVDFAGIEDFIDTPVKFYSSGMFVRLGFAVAVSAEPDVLLVDEVLAVGDLPFQMKCFEKMEEIRERGTTIVVVSHNLNAIRNLCKRAVVLDRGRVIFDGETTDAIASYHDVLALGAASHGHADAAAPAEIAGFRLVDASGASTAHVSVGDEVMLEAVVRFNVAVDDPVFGVQVVTEAGLHVYGDSSVWAERGQHFAAGDVATVRSRLQLSLATGTYTATVGVRASDGETPLAVSREPLLFYVAGRASVRGVADLGGSLDIERD
jgi:ABC-type polysaccharide/polyol phosphate transport system ATPase subunit